MALFKPYKIQSSQLNSLPITEGQLIVTTDDKAMYLDISGSSRIKIYADDIAKIDNLDSIEFVVVESLPTTDIDPNKIYLIANNGTISGGVTYTLTKSGNTITLTGSDSSTSSVTDDTGVQLADLASIATTGAYSDLQSRPNLVTNVETDTTQQMGIKVSKSTSTGGTSTGTIKVLGVANIAAGDTNGTLSVTKVTGQNSTSTSTITVATVPTKVSDLTNDSGFITSYTETDPVFGASAAAGITSSDITNWNGKSTFSGSYNDLTNKPTIPTQTSQLTNNSGYITNSVNNLTNYYTKTDTYTQTEVNTLIGNISTLNLQVVQTLPTTGISTSTIYLVPKTSSGTQNAYDEFIYTNNAWEKIGDTMVDLSNYSTTTEIQGMINSAIGDALEASY